MAEIKPCVEKTKLKNTMGIFEKLNEYKTKMNSLLLRGNTKTCSMVGFEYLERERVTSL